MAVSDHSPRKRIYPYIYILLCFIIPCLDHFLHKHLDSPDHSCTRSSLYNLNPVQKAQPGLPGDLSDLEWGIPAFQCCCGCRCCCCSELAGEYPISCMVSFCYCERLRLNRFFCWVLLYCRISRNTAATVGFRTPPGGIRHLGTTNIPTEVMHIPKEVRHIPDQVTVLAPRQRLVPNPGFSSQATRAIGRFLWR